MRAGRTQVLDLKEGTTFTSGRYTYRLLRLGSGSAKVEVAEFRDAAEWENDQVGRRYYIGTTTEIDKVVGYSPLEAPKTRTVTPAREKPVVDEALLERVKARRAARKPGHRLSKPKKRMAG
jgi:hypothetical protein